MAVGAGVASNVAIAVGIGLGADVDWGAGVSVGLAVGTMVAVGVGRNGVAVVAGPHAAALTRSASSTKMDITVGRGVILGF